MFHVPTLLYVYVCSPDEFIQFLVPHLDVDQHWRPQHGKCPFCLLNFTVYARVEDMQQVRWSQNKNREKRKWFFFKF